MENLYAHQAADMLGISITDLEILEKGGLIHSIKDEYGLNLYSSEEITQILARHGFTVAQEAEQIDKAIQRSILAKVAFTGTILTIVGSIVLAGMYVVSVGVLTTTDPLEVAKKLGIIKNQNNTSSIMDTPNSTGTTSPAINQEIVETTTSQ